VTKLIGINDPRYFSRTSNEPYDRHYYKIVSKDKEVIVESWEEVQEWWWNNNNSPTFDAVVYTVDRPKKKSKGFL